MIVVVIVVKVMLMVIVVVMVIFIVIVVVKIMVMMIVISNGNGPQPQQHHDHHHHHHRDEESVPECRHRRPELQPPEFLPVASTLRTRREPSSGGRRGEVKICAEIYLVIIILKTIFDHQDMC